MAFRGMRSVLLALGCALLVAGCAVRFVYNHLDWIVPWYLDDYIDLDGPQKDLFQKRLDAYLVWHRHTQLPLYADFLDQVADEAQKGLTRADIATIQARTEQLAQAMIERLKPDMMDLFAMATDQQIKDLFHKFDEDNAQFRQESIEVSEKEQRRQRQKEVIHYVERWTGDLNDSQRKLIADWSQKFDLMSEEIADTKVAWQQEFHHVLMLRHDRPAYEQAFNKLLDNPDFGQSPNFKRKFAHNQAILIDLYLALENSLTPSQRKHMVDKLRSYAKDFRSLAKQ